MPFGIVAYALMLFSWTTFLETAVYVRDTYSQGHGVRFSHGQLGATRLCGFLSQNIQRAQK